MTGRTTLLIPENSGSADSKAPSSNNTQQLTATYQGGEVIFRKAFTDDNEKLKAALRDNALDSWVRLSLQREPSYFAGDALMGSSFTVIACDEHQPDSMVGMYSCACLPLHVNGVATQLGYLAGLRVNQQYRHKLRILKNGFSSIKHLVPHCGAAPFMFTSVASENTSARRLLEAGLKGMPLYRTRGNMETLTFNTQQGWLQGLLQPASPQDVPALVNFFNQQAARYQFSPVLTQAWLLSLSGDKGLSLSDFWLAKDGTAIRGCLAIWDQRAFKQTVVRGYRFPINVFRGLYNLFAGATGRVRLPARGRALAQVYLSFVAVDNPAGTFAINLVKEGLGRARQRGADVAILGLSDKNPLTAVLKQTLKPLVYRTCIETVTWPEDLEPILHGYPVQPEVAVL